jgi:tRNA (cmo5U34)-methyltransferase
MNDHFALPLLGERDQLFANTPYPRSFSFDAEVAKVFDDMIMRSIPLYAEVIRQIVQWLRDFPPPAEGRLYDIGCSTGTTLFALGAALTEPTHLVGIDTSVPMLAQAEEKLGPLRARHHVELRGESALNSRFNDAHLVLLNYTLQFIPVTARLQLLSTIYRDLAPQGMVFISEKVVAESSRIHEAYTRQYEAFKERAGYSRTEIQRKKAALDQVLIPLSLDEQIAMLRAAGFRSIDVVAKWQNFATIIAIKDGR